jgi:hypothetical protein
MKIKNTNELVNLHQLLINKAKKKIDDSQEIVNLMKEMK